MRLISLCRPNFTLSTYVLVLGEYLLQARLGLPDHDFAHQHLRGEPLVRVGLLRLAAAADGRRLCLQRVRLLVDAWLGRGERLELGSEGGRVVDVLIYRSMLHGALIDIVLLGVLERD